MDGTYFDPLETRDSGTRERAQMAALSEQIALAKTKTAFFAESLADVDPAEITSRAALA